MPILRDPSTCAIPGINTKDMNAYVALLGLNSRARPNRVVLTVDTLLAKGGTALTVTPAFDGAATDTTLVTRQPLQWFDPATNETGIVFAAADYASGVALTLEAVEEDVPAGATIEFPVRFQLRGDLQSSSTTNVIELDSLDHSFADAQPGTRSATNNLPGFKNHYDAGYWTAVRADEGGGCDVTLGREIYISIEEPVPGFNVANWTRGDAVEGAMFVTGITEGAANNGLRTADVAGRFTSYAHHLAVVA